MKNITRQFFALLFAFSVSTEPLMAYVPLAAPVGSLQANGGNGAFVAASNSTASQTALIGLVGQPPLYVTNYGATCNGKYLNDITTTSASAVISSASYTFTSADVGKYLTINAGTATTTTANTHTTPLITNLASLTGIKLGQSVVGSGIPAGAIVTDINTVTTVVTISKAATSTLTGTSLRFIPVINTTVISASAGSATLNTNMLSSITSVGTATFGTDDTAAIQSAITAGTAQGGGLVTLPFGICVVGGASATSVIFPTEISMTGQGAGKSIIKWISTSDQTTPVIEGYNQANAVTCTTTAAATNQSDNQFTYFEVDDEAATDSTYNVQAKGIGVPCSVRSVIDHVYIHGTPATGIATDTGLPTQVTNNIITNPGRFGLASNTGSNGIGEGVSGLAGEAYLISGNVITNPAHFGIFFETQSATTFQVNAVVNGNTVFQGGNSGPGVNGTASAIGNSGTIGASFTGNYLYGNNDALNWTGITTDNGTVSSNSSGVGTTISGNYLYNLGIAVRYSTVAPSAGNQANISIVGNNLLGGGMSFTPFTSGALLTNLNITGNIISAAPSSCLLFSGTGSATNVVINGNTLANCSVTNATAYREAGIAFGYNVTGITITGNSIYDNLSGNQKYGIGINTGVTIAGANIQNNTISGNATAAFDLLGTLTGTVLNNYGVDLGTKFTTSGCSISATSGTAKSGTFTLGANTCTAVITLNGATGTGSVYTGWTCSAWDETAAADLIGGNTSSSSTTASFTIPVTAGATDVIGFICTPY